MAQDPPTGESGRRGGRAPVRSIWVYAALIAGLVAFAMGQSILFAVLGPLARKLGLGEIHVGALVSLTALVITFAAPWWGRRSDRWGRRLVLVFGLVAYALSMVLFVAAISLGLDGIIPAGMAFGGMLLARLLYALLSAGIQPTAAAVVADRTSGRERAAGLAIVAGAFGVGMVAGPALAAGLSFFGLVAPLLAVTVLALISAVACAFFIPGREAVPPGDTSRRLRMRSPRIAPYLFLMFGVLMVGSATQQTAAFYLQDLFVLDAERTARAVGLVMAVSALAMIATQAVVVQVFKPRPATLVRLGYTAAVATFLTLIMARDFTGLMIGYGGLGLAMGLLYPGIMAAASLSVSERDQGAVAGLMGSATSAGVVVGPLMGTALYQWDPALPLVVCGGIVVAYWAVSWRLRFFRAGYPARIRRDNGTTERS